MREAIDWLEDGGSVGIYCEGIYHLQEPLDTRTAHRKRRGFPVQCGDSQMYVTAILVALIAGACRNLGEDMKCRIYDRRPLVCRIYPAEINPFIELDPATKVCPPEAWPSEPPVHDAFKDLPALAGKSRLTDYAEAGRKGLVCRDLGINITAVAQEGYVRHVPEAEAFVVALKSALDVDPNSLPPRLPWTVYSPSLAKEASTTHSLNVVGQKPADANYEFIRF